MVGKYDPVSIKTEAKPKFIISNLFNSLKEHINLLLTVFKKTFFIDLFNRWKFIFAIIFMIILPVVWLLPQDATFLTAQSSLNELIGIMHIFFTYLTVLPFLLIYSSASLISEEIKMGTMLLLVSKPISRGEIMWGKYIAMLFYNLTISVLSLGIVCLTAFLKHPFYDIIPFFWTQFLFSLIVIAFFGTLTMGLSMVFRNAKTTAVIPLMLLLVMTFLFFIVRPFLMMASPNGDLYYETFQVYNYDLGYHFMNIYVWFYENFISHLPEGTIRWLVSWGIYTIEYDEFSPEFEIYTKTHYQPPHISLLIILIFTVIIIVIGFIIYKRRDIF